MYINWALNEINLKVVYYGPGLSGKTTNLIYIHKKLDPSLRGELITLSTKEDRTLFFDFMQLEIGKINGKVPKFNLYTVPGQVYYANSRKIILNGADGIVFVADSQKERIDENLDTLLDLENNLIEIGTSLEKFPWVLQYNKRDLPSAASLDVLDKKLNFLGVPSFESVAHKGVGVFPTLKELIKNIIAHIRVPA
ncbi:MAG: ADP-ribosylation factor-like protein [candidate division KSB1 bacterium]|jgi:signal recognition particle receptor subunit beta|nr:ADP-ribosylation factor-like protein [candidate division KSB1 bacterium]